MLVENGTLNPDFTPNEATAQRLGWKLVNPEDIPVEQRWWLTAEQRRALQVQSKAKVGTGNTGSKGGTRR